MVDVKTSKWDVFDKSLDLVTSSKAVSACSSDIAPERFVKSRLGVHLPTENMFQFGPGPNWAGAEIGRAQLGRAQIGRAQLGQAMLRRENFTYEATPGRKIRVPERYFSEFG